jgi:hypothetical protein
MQNRFFPSLIWTCISHEQSNFMVIEPPLSQLMSIEWGMIHLRAGKATEWPARRPLPGNSLASSWPGSSRFQQDIICTSRTFGLADSIKTHQQEEAMVYIYIVLSIRIKQLRILTGGMDKASSNEQAKFT